MTIHRAVEWTSKGEMDTRQCGQGMDPPYSQAQVLVVHTGHRIKKPGYVHREPKMDRCGNRGPHSGAGLPMQGATRRGRGTMRTGNNEPAGWRNCQLFRRLSKDVDLRLEIFATHYNRCQARGALCCCGQKEDASNVPCFPLLTTVLAMVPTRETPMSNCP